MTRYDLLSPRKGRDDKTIWHKVGAAFPRDKGGFQLVFDSLPIADNEGRVTLMMWEAKPRDGYQEQRQEPRQQAQIRPSVGDDEIPF